ncbi:Tether containing UBX domain for GLUT4 [Mortierella antarctica]|nr:Tether containing UBX domain for GLUT4 [Mortierella antarctica]
MASNLTVNLGGGKKQLVKTTPTMILRQIVNNVCEKQGYAEPQSYGLKNGKTFLDLSMSIRYANIAPGAKLDLARIPRDRAAPTHVQIALQTEDGERIVQQFALTTTLWDVLRGFEANSTLNLTKRTAAPQPTSKNVLSFKRLSKALNPPSHVYLLPVVILLEREYISIEALKTTTLQLAGLSSGNVVMRVMMRFTDAGLEDFLPEIERDYSSATPPAAPAMTTASAATPVTPTPPPQSPSRKNTAIPTSNTTPQRRTTDKTAGERDFVAPQDIYRGDSMTDLGINAQSNLEQLPGITSRSGDVDQSTREGFQPGPGPSSVFSPSMEIHRQTPAQDMNTAMIEANQEIRQLQEQQTQAALTDRVKRLSKASEGSDRDRFVRSLPPGAGGTLSEEPGEMDGVEQTTTPRSESPSSQLPDQQQEVVRQIAHRISQQLRAQKSGDSPSVNYHALIAQEVAKQQNAGVLPKSPAGSRHNSMYKSKVDDDTPLRKGTGSTTRSPAGSTTATPPTSSSAQPQVNTEPKAEEAPFERNVKVFRPPADNSTPLSNQIDLPDDFYTLTGQEMVNLMNSQKRQREAEENRGFKTAQVRAEEEKAKERRYPKTIIRIRFPDRVQLQATFRSQETVGDVRRWVQGAIVGQGEKFDLYTTPPKKVLADDKMTLYQAGLAPQSIVYFSWVDSQLNLHPPFLNGEHLIKLQDLPIPGQEEPESASSSDKADLQGGNTLSGSSTSNIHMMGKDDRRLTDKMSSDKPKVGGSGSGGLPKWMKLSKK